MPVNWGQPLLTTPDGRTATYLGHSTDGTRVHVVVSEGGVEQAHTVDGASGAGAVISVDNGVDMGVTAYLEDGRVRAIDTARFSTGSGRVVLARKTVPFFKGEGL